MRYADQRLAAFLDAMAAPTPAPGGGAAAAVTAATAAALVAMAARLAKHGWPDSEKAAVRADELRHRALVLADEDATAYAAVIAASRRPAHDPDRSTLIRAALDHATDIPRQIATLAAEVAVLATAAATHGNPNLAGDATAASHLATAAERSAAELVRLNQAQANSGG
jgi:formiminotetrahydrofolate cyclodeaminase